MIWLRDKIMRFMYGRYGFDKLCYALAVIYVLLGAINLFLHSYIVSTLMLAIAIYGLFRIFSRNINSRQRENRFFLELWTKLRQSLFIRRIKEIRTRRFRTCKNCKTVLRLPKKAGKHNVSCPRCKHNFQVRILF